MPKTWRTLDWLDIFLHGLFTIVICGIAVWLKQEWMFVGNIFFWVGREWGQHYEWPEFLELFYRPQIIMEWAMPLVLTGAIWWMFT